VMSGMSSTSYFVFYFLTVESGLCLMPVCDIASFRDFFYETKGKNLMPSFISLHLSILIAISTEMKQLRQVVD